MNKYKSKQGYLIFVFLCLNQIASAQTPSPAKLTLAERAFTASKIYSLVQRYFAGWKAVPDLDLDIAYRNYLGQAIAINEHKQFDLITMELRY